MEQICEVAMAYYKRSPAEEKEQARKLFSSLDVDGDGRVSRAEFKSVLGSDKLFGLIDKNGDGTLDFVEVLTLFYMTRIGIRICDGCGDYLPGSHFSCVLCEMGTSYDLCCACYGGGEFHHHHSADNFIDDRSMRLLLTRFLQQANDQPANPKGNKVRKAVQVISVGHNVVSIGSNMVSIGTAAVQSGCVIM